MSVSSSLRDRLDALPLDRAPLRRAGVLTVLLVVLLVLGKVFGPGRPASAATSASRHDVQGATEEVSAPRAAPAWTGGRVLAILLLAAGGGVALVLHRRRPGAASKAETTLDVIETHPLGPGQSLRLVACGAEVLLLSVGTDGARLLRHWPRETFDRTTVSFADALAEAAAGFSAEPDVDAVVAARHVDEDLQVGRVADAVEDLVGADVVAAGGFGSGFAGGRGSGRRPG